MLALVWFVIVNGVATVAVAAFARQLIDEDRARPASLWMGLRLLPAAASTVVVMAIFLPSYWLHEPRDYTEGSRPRCRPLALFALGDRHRGNRPRGGRVDARVAARGVVGAAFRSRSRSPAPRFPRIRIDADAPVMALVGVCEPRLFISRSVIAALNDEELAASVAHEVGHRRALDNFKRLAVPARARFSAGTRWRAPSSSGGRLPPSRLRIAARPTAPATKRGAAARCALASAIVKVARMMPRAGGDGRADQHARRRRRHRVARAQPARPGARNDRPERADEPDLRSPSRRR